MVDKRLEEMHTSQMTESTVNLELVEVLKKHGPNVILAIAIFILAFRGWLWISEKMEEKRAASWIRLMEDTDNYWMLAEVGDDLTSIGSISELAWLNAADMRLKEVLIDESLEWDPHNEEPTEPIDDEPVIPDEEKTPPPMTDEERETALTYAEGLYQKVIEKCNDDPAKQILAAKAMFGIASVAEMRIESADSPEQLINTASTYYGKVVETVGESFPKLAALATNHMGSLDQIPNRLILPTNEQILEANKPPLPPTPEIIEPEIGDQVGPPVDDSTTEQSAESTTEETTDTPPTDNDDKTEG